MLAGHEWLGIAVVVLANAVAVTTSGRAAVADREESAPPAEAIDVVRR